MSVINLECTWQKECTYECTVYCLDNVRASHRNVMPTLIISFPWIFLQSCSIWFLLLRMNLILPDDSYHIIDITVLWCGVTWVTAAHWKMEYLDKADKHNLSTWILNGNEEMYYECNMFPRDGENPGLFVCLSGTPWHSGKTKMTFSD